MKLTNILFFAFIVFAIQLNAKKVYVNDNSSAGDIYTTAVGLAINNGTTTSTPKLTLAQALAISINGDTILVDKGNYLSTNNTINVQVTIIGAGTGNTVFTGNATVNRFGTISVSNVKLMNMNFINYYLSQEGQVLLINSGLTGIIFENIVIRKNPGTATAGANVLVSSGSNVVFNNCVFSCSGWNADFGGALYIDNSTVTINSCLFKDDRNFARYGGAIYMFGANPNVTISNSTFSECSARRGGAIYQNSGVLTVNGCCFLDNFSAGDASDPNHGGGAFCQNAGTSSFVNCKFNNNYNSQGTDPNNSSVDGGAILFRGATGTFSFNTCSFANNIPYDTGADFYLDKGTSLTGTITNCTFTTAPVGEVNIRNFDMAASDVVLSNSGTPSFLGTIFTASGCNTLLPSTTPTAFCMNTTIANCSAVINCATETFPPLIISCVSNKTLTGCSGVLGNYIAEVVAFDDCSFNVSQSPSPGTIITAVTQVTMTVTDQAGNSSLCTFFVTPGSGGVSLAATSTASITCFNASTGAATVTPSGGLGTYTVTWMPGSLTGTVQTGLTANVYTVTATDGTCSATQNITIAQPASAVSVSLSVSSNTICSNNTVTLTPSGASTYTLNPGNLIGTSFTVSPNSNQTYTLTGTSASGCLSANSATTAITVNTTPTVSIVSVSNSTICSGSSAIITPTATPIGAVSYTLNPGNLIGTSFTVSPNSNQMYTLTGTSASGCLSANSATTAITVNTTPTVVIAAVSNSVVCSGNSTTISPTANPVSAVSYTLTNGVQSYTVFPFIFSPTVTATYTLIGTSSSGCISTNAPTITIISNATPTVNIATNNLSLCTGNPLVMPIVSGGTVIQWNGPNSFTSSLAQPTVTSAIAPINAGNYSVTVTQTYGANTCTSSVAQVSVSVVSSVNIGVTGGQTQNLCFGSIVNIIPTGGNTYTLQPSNNVALSYTLNPISNTTYTLLGSAGNGCDGSTTFSVNVNPLPLILVVASNTSICTGNSATLSVSSGSADSYTWSANAGLATTSTVVVNPLINTTYTITGTNAATGCTNTAVQNIVVNTTPTVAIAAISNATICSGNSTIITPTGANSYTLNPGNLSGTNFTVSPASNQTYSITGTSSVGCLSENEATTNITVNQTPTITIAAVSNATLCSGNSTIIIPSGANSYTLNPGNVTGTNFTVSPTSSQTYSIAGTSNAGCLSSNGATVTITINQLPILQATANPNTICTSGTVNLNAINTSTTAINSFTWSAGNGINTTNQNLSNPTFPASALTTGSYTYSVIATDVNGCVSAQASATLSVINIPNANFDTSDLVICQNENASISINAPQSGATYNWAINGQNINNTNPLSIPINVISTPGTYTIITTASIGTCTNSAVSLFKVNALPVISLLNPNVNECENTTAQLNVALPNILYTYVWTNGQSTVTGPNLIFTSLTQANAGTYSVAVTDQNGCINNTVGTIEIMFCETFVPEIFTPNGDGKNDGFVIKNIENYPNNKLQIFNRWGSMVYQKNGYLNEFEGYANTGEQVGKSKLPAGTYYVILDYGNQTKTYNGILLLAY